MSFKLKMLPLAVAQVIAGGAFSMIAASPVMAQSSTDATTGPVQRVEITGSNIRRADAETPSPVQVITADDLKKSGYTSISQVLSNITANGQGMLSAASPSSFAAGGSGIALRGLDTAATLVLIDGHRMAPYPLPDNAQFSFVDVTNIPFDTIERVEVLKDGASAVYGSDAMAGVVNIILKKNYVGTKVNVEGGTTTEGGGGTVHASVIHGFGDYDNDGYNAYISLEYRHQNEITWADRLGDGAWANMNLNGIGGVNKTPGVISPLASTPVTLSPYLSVLGSTSDAIFGPGASCSNAQLNSAAGCPWTPHTVLDPDTRNIDLMASFSKKLSDGWRFDFKASIFDVKTELVSNPYTFPQSYVQGGATTGGLAFNANTAPTLVGPGNFAVNVPANYLQTLGLGGMMAGPASIFGNIPGSPDQTNTVESKSSRIVGDISGSIGDWDLKGSLGFTKVGTSQDYNAALNIPALQAALNRTVNPFNVFSTNNSAADYAAIFPSTSAYDTSTLEFGEFHVSRSLMQMPGGDLGFSSGVTYTHRDLESPAPYLAGQGVVGLNNAFSSGTQNDAAVYAELAIPVMKTLEIDTDARLDHFDTVGNAHTGKLAFKWTPSDIFALRGSASNGFRAPNPSESGKAGAFAFASAGYDPVYCPGGPNANGTYPVGSAVNFNGANLCNYTPTALSVANPNLQPERSTAFTLGSIIEPIKGWSTTLDLYKITVRDQIISPQLNYATATPVRSSTQATAQCTTDGTTADTTPCQIYPILYYPNPYINANSTQTSGIEVGTRYKFKLADYGTLKTEFDWTHVFSYLYTAGGTTYQLVGTHGPEVISNDTGNPQDRVQATFTWDKGPWEVATTFNWTGGFSLTDTSVGQDTCAEGAGNDAWFLGNQPQKYCEVHPFLDTDLTVRYNVNKQLAVHGSITNLFNTQAPVDLETYGNGFTYPVDLGVHFAGVVGRTINIGATYTF